MKKLLAIMLSLFVVSSMAFAKPTAQLDFATMNKANTQFLFQNGAKVATLGKAEMKETEGKWLPLAIFVARITYSGWKAYRAYRQTRSIYRGYKALSSGYRYAKPSRWEHLRLGRGGHSLRIRSHRGRIEFRGEIHPYKGFRYLPHFHARPGISRHRPWGR